MVGKSKRRLGSGLSALSGRGVWQAPWSCALSGKTLKKLITVGGEIKSVFTSMAQPVPLRGTALISGHSRAAETGGERHVRTRELAFSFLLKHYLVLHLDCFLSEAKERK